MPMDLSEALECHRLGLLDRAASLYEAALAEDPDRDEALHLLGLVTLQRGDPRQAAALIESGDRHPTRRAGLSCQPR